MIGVIAGDVIGSVHEHALTKSTDFPLFDPHCRFTDDTVRHDWDRRSVTFVRPREKCLVCPPETVDGFTIAYRSG